MLSHESQVSNPGDREKSQAEVVIPGEPSEVAEEIASVSVEGRPGDPKSGPTLLRAEVGAVLIVVLLAAIVVGLWFGLQWGLAVLGIGVIGTFCNPIMGAALLRANERQAVVEHQLREQRAKRDAKLH